MLERPTVILTVEKLRRHALDLRNFDLRGAFNHDPQRAEKLSLSFGDWRIDFSRQKINDETLVLLREYAEKTDLPRWVAALFSGETLNHTEKRAALHTALRQQEEGTSFARREILRDVRGAQQAMKTLSERLRCGALLGASGKPVKTVVNLGIGGSSLGPQLVCDALLRADDFDVRFASNLDAEDLERALLGLDRETTLFIVASKTFKTEETLTNARAALDWLQADGGNKQELLNRHFVAVTASDEAAKAFGIAPENILPLWDWVGGRYSLWSAVGITIAIQSGWQTFVDLLAGAAAMDKHFHETPIAHNAPIMLALIDWWNTCFAQIGERIVVPYAFGLRLLPAYLQQLLMESNGKQIDWDGNDLHKTAGARSAVSVWGGIGTDSQHAFFQWLHQGSHRANIEFIVPTRYRGQSQRVGLLAHALAQPQALMCGRDCDFEIDAANATDEDIARAARVCPGNRASTMLLLPDLNAWHLGAFLALYEHRAFIEGVLYRVNPFDQFGVELGKALACPLHNALERNTTLADVDAATQAQLLYVQRFRK